MPVWLPAIFFSLSRLFLMNSAMRYPLLRRRTQPPAVQLSILRSYLFFSSIFSCLFALLIILSFSFLSFYPFDLSMGLSGLFHLLMVRSMPRGRLQHKTSFLLYSVSMSGLAETTIQQLLQPAVSARRQSAFFGISHNDSVPARSRNSSSTISAASPTCRRQGRDA